MPVARSISDNKRVMHWEISDPFTVEDVLEFADSSRAIFDEFKQLVHNIAVVINAKHVPKDFWRLWGGKLADWNHPMSGQLAIVGANSMMRSILTLMKKVGPALDRIVFFDSLEDAETYIQKVIASEGLSDST